MASAVCKKKASLLSTRQAALTYGAGYYGIGDGCTRFDNGLARTPPDLAARETTMHEVDETIGSGRHPSAKQAVEAK